MDQVYEESYFIDKHDVGGKDKFLVLINDILWDVGLVDINRLWF